MVSPFPGLRAYAPVKTPLFSLSPTFRDTTSRDATSRLYAPTSCLRSAVVTRSTMGCSGASTRYVAPYSVSGRVVNTAIFWPPGTSKTSSAPSERPIQFAWGVRVEGDQSSVARWSSRRSAYPVILKNHWSSERCSTGVSQRSHLPAITCSLARTVLSLGHQLTDARFRYARPAL